MNKERLKNALLALGKIVLTAALTVFFKAWFGGEPLKGLTKLSELGAILKATVPFWTLLVTVVVCVLLFPSWLRSIRRARPKLFTAWQGTSGWGWGGILQKDGTMENVLAIHGDVIITTENLDGIVTLVDVRLNGAKRASNFMNIIVKPGATFQQKIVVFFRGLTPAPEKPFTARFTFVDNKGREYPVAPVELRALPNQQQNFQPQSGA